MSAATDRLNEFVQVAYGGSKRLFAEALGWKPPSVYSYLNGKQRADADAFLLQVEEKAGGSRQWIKSGEGSMFADNAVGRALAAEHPEHAGPATKSNGVSGSPWSVMLRETIDGMRAVGEEIGPQIPLMLNPASAGYGQPAEDTIDRYLTMFDFAPNPDGTFAVRATGASMLYDGIRSGDLLIVDRTIDPESGDVIVAALNGEVVVKRLEVKGAKLWLMPANDEFEPVPVKTGMKLEIWGVVTRIVHEMKPSKRKRAKR